MTEGTIYTPNPNEFNRPRPQPAPTATPPKGQGGGWSNGRKTKPHKSAFN